MPVAVSVSDPLPVQPLTVNVLPALVAVRLAVVMPLRPSAMPSVEESDVLVSVKLALLLAATVSAAAALSVSDPLPVQPLTVKVLPPRGVGQVGGREAAQGQRRQAGHRQRRLGQDDAARHDVHQGLAGALERSAPGPAGDGEGVAARPVSVRLAVVMPLKPSDMPSVEESEVLVRVKPALLLAVTVSPVAAVSVSDPLPVQPLTVKVLPPAVSVRLAVVKPLSVRVGSPVTASDVLVNVAFAATVSTRVSAVPVSVPFPVQPLTVKVLPPELVSVRLAVVMPLKAERHAVGGRQRRVGQGEAGALARRHDARRRVGQRPGPRPAADGERLAGSWWR